MKRAKPFRTALQVRQSAAAQREYDQRRARESETRRLYWTARWRKLAKAHLDQHPLCVMCDGEGSVEPATVCDHVTPHRGEIEAFWSGPFQSLCKAHHDGAKQREERSLKAFNRPKR